MSNHRNIPVGAPLAGARVEMLDSRSLRINRNLKICAAHLYSFPRGAWRYAAVERSETDEECGRQCSSSAEVCTYSCVGQRKRYAVHTMSQCVSRVPLPTSRSLGHLLPGRRGVEAEQNSPTTSDFLICYGLSFQAALFIWSMRCYNRFNKSPRRGAFPCVLL